jgi:prephenate dehydrogenase
MLAGVLARALASGGYSRDALGPGGRDMTRLAGSSPAMWTAIASENSAHIGEALAAAEHELAALRAALADAEVTTLRERFERARAWFDGV